MVTKSTVYFCTESEQFLKFYKIFWTWKIFHAIQWVRHFLLYSQYICEWKIQKPISKIYLPLCHITTWIRFVRKMLLLIYYNDIKHARVVLLLNTRHPKMWVSNSKNQFMTACEMVVKKFAWFETENILKSYFFLREDI